jgi:flagellar motor switch/type III secretory pathway protein FliN
MAVDTKNNQTTEESQLAPQPPDQSDSNPQEQPPNEPPAEEQPVATEINDDDISTYESKQPEADLDEIDTLLSPSKTNNETDNIERILNMKVPIIVRIAKKKLKVAEVMKLNIGTVIQFDQDAYQHIDLLVNNEVIGLGQPVKVGENFGLKITQLGDINHTIKSLGQVSDSEII